MRQLLDPVRRRCLALAAGGWLAAPGTVIAAPVLSVADAVLRSAAAAPLTHGVVVEQHGALIAESYFTADDKPSGALLARTVAFDADTLHDMRSVTKSVVALLAGVAHGRGQLDRERPVLDWFPEHADLATPERRAIRLEHLLTMTAGIAWDETTLSYGDAFNSATRLSRSDEPVAFVLSREMVSAPGSRFVYSGGATLLLGAIVERATGRPLDELARETLFAPFGIERFEWRRHPRWNRTIPDTGLRLAPRSMLRLGRLVLAQGRNGGQSLVPEEWLDQSQQPRVSAGPVLKYGWHWWVGRISAGPAAGTGWFAALGNGGQVLMCVPRLDTVIAVTAGRYGTAVTPSLVICRAVIEALLA